jgi:predicted ATPase/DNA-binding SARP family transcriptional activator
MLTVGVLGPLEVRRDGRPLSVPSGRTTEVLVRLALDAGQLVSAERLIDDLWGAAAAGTGRNTLQSKVSQLRRALGEPALVSSGHGGYTLALDPGRVDALQVVGLAATAAAARRAGDPASAMAAATEALGLFRGEVLVDAGDGEWLQPHRARLDEVRLGLLEDRAAAGVDLGGGAEMLAELEWLVGQHPLREGLWASYITALYRAGRQADALAASQRVRRLLVDELGIEPGTVLRDLERQVLRQSAILDTAPAAAAAAPTLVVGNLPTLSTPLVGRGDDLAAVGRLLDSSRLVTLVGPAGVGKTRTALEVVRSLHPAGGVWLVRLEVADAASSVLQLVTEALQLTGGEQALLDRFAGAETVLVLDNCEHVVDGAADLATRLLDQTRPLRILTTSQAPLGVDGETLYALDPLPLADSVTLFADRAARTRRRFALDDDTTATVEAVCRSLDGLPLAIELAAARVKSLSVREIARRLDDRFTLLQDPTSRRPERRRALAAAIAWSYDLLFPDDQRGLWALSCFSGGAPLAAAEHVLTALGVPGSSAVDVIGRLADRSMLSVETAENGTTRYRLLDSIRAFAGTRLTEAGQVDDADAAHAAWFAQAADRCAATVRGRAQPDCLALVRAERANIDSALAWAAAHDPGLGLRLANGFGWTWVVLGDGVAGAARVRSALEAARSNATPRERATGLLLAGWLEASAGNVDQAQHDLDGALAAAERLGDDRLLADAQRHLAFLRIQQGRPPGRPGAGRRQRGHLPAARPGLGHRGRPPARRLRVDHGGRHRQRHPGCDRGGAAPDPDRGQLGPGARRGDARGRRQRRASLRRRRRRPHPGRRALRAARVRRPGRPPPHLPWPRPATLRQPRPGRRHPCSGHPGGDHRRRPSHGGDRPDPSGPHPARRRGPAHGAQPARGERPLVPGIGRGRRRPAHPLPAGRPVAAARHCGGGRP